jgi:hypothetical protein
MVSGQEASENPDRGLEQVDVLVNAELELRPDPFASLVKLVLKSHDQHRVQRIDNRQAQTEPVLGRFGNWSVIGIK